MTTFISILTTVCIGSLIGTEFVVSAFVNPVLRKLDDCAQARAISLFAIRLGKAMPFWYLVSLVLLVAEAAMRRHDSGSVLLIAAAAIWLVVIVLTIFMLVPINNRMMKLDAQSFPEAARQEHHRWDALHRLRVIALTGAMVCFLLALR